MTIGQTIYRTDITHDSMKWAREHIQEAPDGAVFLANTLTHARGRQGRVWSIYPGQLLVTLILKPSSLELIHHDDLSIRINQLNMAMTVGIQEALNHVGVLIKWPNDFLINDKKIGGILSHVVWQGTKPIGIIVGFGLNINNEFAQDDPLYEKATSIKQATQLSYNIRDLYKAIIHAMDNWYTVWKNKNFMLIYKQWKQVQAIWNKTITIHQKDGTIFSGLAKTVLPNGDLLLADQNGKQHIISFYQVEEVVL